MNSKLREIRRGEGFVLYRGNGYGARRQSRGICRYAGVVGHPHHIIDPGDERLPRTSSDMSGLAWWWPQSAPVQRSDKRPFLDKSAIHTGAESIVDVCGVSTSPQGTVRLHP